MNKLEELKAQVRELEKEQKEKDRKHYLKELAERFDIPKEIINNKNMIASKLEYTKSDWVHAHALDIIMKCISVEMLIEKYNDLYGEEAYFVISKDKTRILEINDTEGC